MNALAKPFQPFTSAEFHKMARRGAFGDLRVELRRGMIVKMSPKHVPHARAQMDIAWALKSAVAAAGLKWEVLVEASVSFGEGFDPVPDIVVIDPAMQRDPQGTVSPDAVKLIVEVADSSLDDDLGEKRGDYAHFGLVEYWVADVNARIVHLHADPRNGSFARLATASLADPLTMLTQPSIVAQIG